MASLALMVCFIFLATLLLGPMSMALMGLGFRRIAAVFALLAILVGAHWALAAPFPVSLVGLLGIASGVSTIRKI